jgi:Flp pilus assembly protein TadG
MFARLERLKTKFRRFPKARRGATAIEFAIVIIPFFMLTAGLAEVALIGFAQTSLDFAVSEAARLIRTGQAQTANMSATQMRDTVCNQANQFLVMSCSNNLFLDVNRFNSFVDADAANTDPTADGTLDDSDVTYAPGAASDIVVVRAYYRWHVLTPMFEPIFQNMGNGDRILVSTMMFRNEPW